MCEKQSCKYQGERRRRERGCSRHWSRDFSATPREDHDEADLLTGDDGADVHALKEDAASGKTPVEAGEQHEEEGAEVRSCYELTITPISHHPKPLWGRKFGVRSEGVKLMLAGRRDARKVF